MSELHTPFQCDNCGRFHTVSEVLLNAGDCIKCHDTIITYTVDAAERLSAANAKVAELENRWNNLLSSCGCEERNFATILHELRQQNLELTSKCEKLTGYLAHEATLNLELEAKCETMKAELSKQVCQNPNCTAKACLDIRSLISLTPSSAICRECSGKGQGAAQDSIWSSAPFSCPKCNGTGKVQLPPSSAGAHGWIREQILKQIEKWASKGLGE